MTDSFGNMIRRTSAYFWLRKLCLAREKRKGRIAWEKCGCPNPPPHFIKQQVIEHFAQKFGTRVFVETGTYYGDMVDAMRERFDQIYSIELSEFLCQAANKRFARYKHIEIIHGDSAVELKKLLAQINQPALFWLDGHYSAGITARGSKDCPVLEELEPILKTTLRHVIIIDDARCFGSESAYPSLEELTAFVKRFWNDADISVDLDCIRIIPK